MGNFFDEIRDEAWIRAFALDEDVIKSRRSERFGPQDAFLHDRSMDLFICHWIGLWKRCAPPGYWLPWAADHPRDTSTLASLKQAPWPRSVRVSGETALAVVPERVWWLQRPLGRTTTPGLTSLVSRAFTRTSP